MLWPDGRSGTGGRSQILNDLLWMQALWKGARWFMKRNSEKLFLEHSLFQTYYRKLLAASDLEQIAQYPQHGSTSRLLHCVAVAYYSYRFALFTRLTFHLEELVRGALLHDYFFYDAQDGDPAHKGHWSRHPAIALENAGQKLALTRIEEDIIAKHMFPLTGRPPRYRESVLVSLADKACSVYEFFRRRSPYQKLRQMMGSEQLSAGGRPAL